MNSISYSITASEPAAHLFRVRCQIPSPSPDGQILRLPNWIPGSYMIRDFARHIVQISANDDNGAVSLEKLDKCRWRAAPANGDLIIEYDVYAWDLSVRAAHLDCTHGYFNGTSVFLLPEGRESDACDLEILAPMDSHCEHWQVATSMQTIHVDDDGFGRYRADNYDDLIDHPVEMGQFERHGFTACGVEHELVLSGRFKTDPARICDDLVKICEEHIRFFGEPAPFDRYMFMVMVVGDGCGGLEHRFSTSLLVSRDTLPIPGHASISDGYLEFLGLCSHEYFHAWNVKRIRPARLAEANLDAEAHTTLLWAFEGITSYYDDLALVRSGLIDANRYLKQLAKTLTRVAQNPGRLCQSIADSSFDAWTKFYKQDENAPNAIVSYYSKGTLVALALDMTLRESSGGATSLDDLMQLMWGHHGSGKAVAEKGIELLAAELVDADLGVFFDQSIRGTHELPLAELLPQVGVSLEWRHARGESAVDRGHDRVAGSTALAQGMRLRYESGLAQITHVLSNSAAQCAGLSAGDILLAIDGLRVSEKKLSDTLRRFHIGEHVEVWVFRGDELMHFDMQLEGLGRDTAHLLIDDSERVAGWLGDASVA